MKLVEILARELEKWRGGAECATQEADSRTVYFWKSCKVSNHGGEWFHDAGMGLLSHDWSLRSETIASDHATAIVTREMWQAERERIAKPGKKANADGWIRHRGGKCPVDGNEVVVVKLRDGSVKPPARACAWAWHHTKDDDDIMRYKLHKPAEQPFDPEKAEKDAVEAGAVITVEADIDFPSGLIHIDGPLAWRDRIREIDRTVEALEEERVSLIQRLEGEGFKLIDQVNAKIAEATQAHEDMSDWRNWKIGDLVEVLHPEHSGLTSGNKYAIKEIEPRDSGSSLPVFLDTAETWLDIENMQWHSRPSA